MSLFTIRELVGFMQESEDADYGNWGILIDPKASESILIGLEQEGRRLVVPLLDIIDCANECLPTYGFEEIYLCFGFDDRGEVEWAIMHDD